jgi:hypothetical protein
MNVNLTLLIISLVIGVVGSLPSARTSGVRLPNCGRVLQMQRDICTIGIVKLPVSVSAIG